MAPRLVVSTLLVLMVGPALPDWAGIGLFYGGLVVAALLVLGLGESLAVRVLFNARRLTPVERTGLAAVAADLCHLELGPPIVDLYVARRRGAPAAIAHGRRSIVMAPEFVNGILRGDLPRREAVAVLAHASLVTRSGLVRHDAAIVFWSTPWRVLAVVGRPARGLLGFAWRIRVVVFGAAIWQSATDGSSAPGPLNGPMIAVALSVILALTYLVPRWAIGWENLLASTGDRELIARDLGQPMAAFLRRYPQTSALVVRVRLLDPPVHEKPQLRLVGT
ncbi:hypothetical protein [Aeromicrobium ginsengisoli]|uniref:M48 family metalloprotease n=1 Tax=Aeromicrobium ginsengisoli TaxID=363867 RepID=A0A5M4FF49_9ACTN|nr:hypothetical protein [Aeromicrobium ginsengisoli]KAA1397839.1 hypothetical protein ESP70_010880 [Aeromicrobium ginsengisoli]